MFIGSWRWNSLLIKMWSTSKCENTPFIDLINNKNYNFKHLDIREQFIWLMSNEDNFIINQLSDIILKLHSSRNDIIQN
jgi:hypothetical protein